MEEQKSLPTIAILVVIVVAAGFLLTKTRAPSKTVKTAGQIIGTVTPTEPPFNPAVIPPVSAQDYVKGDATADTTIILYSDSQCPYCRVFYPVLMNYLSQNPNVRLVYRPTPFHATGQVEEKAVDCANDQGKVWEYLNAIYVSPDKENITDATRLTKIATDLGLDGSVFSQCFASDKYAAKTDVYLNAARSAKINGTPTSIIIGKNGTTPLEGAVSAEQLAKVVDSVK